MGVTGETDGGLRVLRGGGSLIWVLVMGRIFRKGSLEVLESGEET